MQRLIKQKALLGIYTSIIQLSQVPFSGLGKDCETGLRGLATFLSFVRPNL